MPRILLVLGIFVTAGLVRSGTVIALVRSRRYERFRPRDPVDSRH